jgi:hypothetical protein
MRTRDTDRLNRRIARGLGNKVQWSDGWDNWVAKGPANKVWFAVPDYSGDLNACVAACQEASAAITFWGAHGNYAAKVSIDRIYAQKGADTPALALALALDAAMAARKEK